MGLNTETFEQHIKVPNKTSQSLRQRTRRQLSDTDDINLNLISGDGDQLVQEEEDARPQEEVVEERSLTKTTYYINP